jgi:hypothetical protein
MVHTKNRVLECTLLVLVLAASLFLRLAALDAFTTTDEPLWHYRSGEFSRALDTDEWQYTYQSGHPGVVTMWLGVIAQRVPWLQEPLPGIDDGIRRLMRLPAPASGTGIPSLTLGARRLVAVVTWLGILALYSLLRRLFGARIALFGTTLVSLDPFFLAHSRFHHLDGLLATFVMVSVASLLVYQFRGRRVGYLLLSAAAAALATANKSPGILLAPWAGAALLLPAFFAPAPKRRRELLLGAGALALWGAVAALLFYAIWPSMWLRAGWTLQQVFDVAVKYAGTPHENSNYFWGAVRPDPGPAFYPVAWAFRSTPLVWLGLAVLALAWKERSHRGPMLMILLLVLPFVGAMTVGDKKFDRYLLPVFPLLDIFAAAGWVALAQWLATRGSLTWRQRCPGLLAAGVAVASFALIWPTRPYYISYYNPIVGGSEIAPQVLLVGWGEGLDRAAVYLNGKPDAGELVVCSWNPSELGNSFVGSIVDGRIEFCPSEPDYYVFYRNLLQRDLVPEISSRFVGVKEPDFVARVNGIDYAWVYANTMYSEAEQQILDHILAQADPARDVIVLDGNAYLARAYQGPVPMDELTVPEQEDAVRTRLQEIAVGRRHLWQIVYPGKGCRSRLAGKLLEKEATVVDEITVDGLRAVCYDLPAKVQFVTYQPSHTVGTCFGPITLLGYDVSDAELTPGAEVRLRLYWQASEPVRPSYTVFAQLFGPDGEMRGQADSLPQDGARPTFTWAPGEVILDDHVFQVPEDAPAGEYRVLVGLYSVETMERLQAVDAAGQRLPDDAWTVEGLRLPAR